VSGIGTQPAAQPVRQHLAVLEAHKHPRRHDCADQWRHQVGREEVELSREYGRPKLARGIDASAGDRAKADNSPAG
jgi:hypothetical protein